MSAFRLSTVYVSTLPSAKLKEETKKSLEDFQLTRQVLDVMPTPFTSNRDTVLYPPSLLRDLTQLLRDKGDDNRKALFKSLITSKN